MYWHTGITCSPRLRTSSSAKAASLEARPCPSNCGRTSVCVNITAPLSRLYSARPASTPSLCSSKRWASGLSERLMLSMGTNVEGLKPILIRDHSEAREWQSHCFGSQQLSPAVTPKKAALIEHWRSHKGARREQHEEGGQVLFQVLCLGRHAGLRARRVRGRWQRR